MRQLRDKRVLITGAARGIGLSMAVRFAAEGAEVVAVDLREDELPGAAEAIRAAGGAARTYPLDVTDHAGIEALRGRLHDEAGPIDVLVNNAGVVFGGPLLEVPLARHLLTYRVNVEGLVAMTRAFLPDLVSRPEAHLVNVASASGYIGLPLGTTYASSKWAVLGFTESLRLELEHQGQRQVKLTAVCPSYVGTGLFDGARAARTTRVLTPEKVADLTVRAVKKNRRNVRTPWLVKITPTVKGVLPSWLFDRVSGLFGVTKSMTGWRGRGDGEKSP